MQQGHSRTKTKSPQICGICERFHRTVLDEFYRVVFRRKISQVIEELQSDLDTWLVDYNQRRPHQGRWCFGNTPMQTFLDAIPLAKEKNHGAVTTGDTCKGSISRQRLSDQVSTITLGASVELGPAILPFEGSALATLRAN